MGSLPESMTAAYVTKLGAADRIRVGSLPVPVPGTAEVLVRTEALVVNHVDTFVRSGAYPTSTPFPFVVGRDLVGTVAARGDQAGAFEPGERVWCNSLGHHGRQGSFAEYALVPGERLYRLPDGIDPVDAVIVLHTAATAHLGLVRDALLRPGATVVIGGAGGGVGSAAVQLAASLGARVIATCGADDAQWCRGCGAAVTLDYHDPNLARRIAEAAPDGVDVYWDSSGHHDFAATLPLLARGGRVLVTAGLDAVPILPAGELYTRDARLLGFAISNASVVDLAAAARTINDLLTRRVLHGRIALRLPLREAAQAHRRQETGEHPPGRIVVLP